MHTDTNRLNELSEAVLGCAFIVLNTLGPGFLEKVYENALAHELRKSGLAVAQQRGVTVTYDGAAVGELLEPESLLGTWRRFGPVGPVYEIIGIGKELPDHDRMMRVRVVESGEEVDYRCTDILDDPRER